MPEGAIIRATDPPSARPTKSRVSGTASQNVTLDFPEGVAASAIWRILLPSQNRMGVLTSDDLEVVLRYTSQDASGGNVGWQVEAAIADQGDPFDNVTAASFSAVDVSTNQAYAGAIADEQENTVTLAGLFTGIDTAKNYTLFIKITRLTVGGDLVGGISLLPSFLVVQSGVGGGTPSGVYIYEAPVAPQFSRWSPEIYLPLASDLSDDGPYSRTLSPFGPNPPAIVAGGPFGDGCLEVQAGAVVDESYFLISANKGIRMSRGPVGLTPTGWSMGFWFRSVNNPTTYATLLTTGVWAADEKTVGIGPNGRLYTIVNPLPPYEPTATDICDGNWHLVVLEFYPSQNGAETGAIQQGQMFLDGSAVGYAVSWATSAYPTEAAVQQFFARCDNVATYQLSDFWYQNAPMAPDLPSLLWNGGTGRRFNDPDTGLIELARA